MPRSKTAAKYPPQFKQWMRDLQQTAIRDFGFVQGSLAAESLRVGAPEASEWFLFYREGMTPREALIEDFQNS